MGLLDTALNSALGLYGDKPKVPRFTPTDFGKEAGNALKENLANLPLAAQFASQFNELSGDQMLAALEQSLPGYSQLRDQGTQLIQSQLRGEVPKDVERQLLRRSAERGVSLGTSGSGMQGNDFLRNFGLTSLQQTQQGLDSAAQWMNQAASRTPVYNMGNAFVPVQQRIGIRAQENQFGWNRNWLRNQVAAMPSPEQQAWSNAITSESNMVTNLAGSALGMAGGAAGGSGGGGL